MRDRLIELLKKKYDHFCDQCGVNKDSHYTENLADYLIENGVIVPPCKVGDKVYQTDFVRIYESTINEVTYTENKVIYVTENIVFDENAIGKSIFLTREEAEQALKGGAE